MATSQGALPALGAAAQLRAMAPLHAAAQLGVTPPGAARLGRAGAAGGTFGARVPAL
jgi:hypothetical protein